MERSLSPKWNMSARLFAKHAKHINQGTDHCFFFFCCCLLLLQTIAKPIYWSVVKPNGCYIPRDSHVCFFLRSILKCQARSLHGFNIGNCKISLQRSCLLVLGSFLRMPRGSCVISNIVLAHHQYNILKWALNLAVVNLLHYITK